MRLSKENTELDIRKRLFASAECIISTQTAREQISHAKSEQLFTPKYFLNPAHTHTKQIICAGTLEGTRKSVYACVCVCGCSLFQLLLFY